MKKVFSICLLLASFSAMAQYTTPRFGTTPGSDNTGRVLTYGYISKAYAATDTIVANAYETTVKIGTLTGAQTLRATVTKCHVGDKLSILFTDDGSARVITFSTGFSSGGTLTMTASGKATVYFVFNGVGWFQLSGENLVTGLAGDGSVGAPGIGFTSDTDNGFYRIGANHWAATVGGTKAVDFSSTGIGVTGNIVTTTANIRKHTATAYTANATVTSAELAGGLLTITSGTDTLTLPAAATLATYLGATAGTVFEFTVLNIASGGTALVSVNTGIVASGFPGTNTLSLANSATIGVATFRIVFLSATAATLARIS